MANTELDQSRLASEEILPTIPIGVYDETDPLKSLAVWGLPGPETVLAQFLPLEQSLFYSEFDVSKARNEYIRMIDSISSAGVDVVVVQDKLVELLNRGNVNTSPKNVAKDNIPHSITQLSNDLVKKGYRMHYESRVGNLDQLDLIPQLVQDDADRYGEEKAILLNWMLSLRHQLPSGNTYYGRDQSNVLGDKLFLSRMRWPIRKPEVGFWRQALIDHVGKENIARIYGKKHSFLEGGDGIMMNGDIFLGVGGRTNLPGAFGVYRGAEDYLRRHDKDMYVVLDDTAERGTYSQKSPEDEQLVMHLDTFWMPFGDGSHILCSLEDVEKRQVHQLHRGGSNSKITLSPGEEFITFMEDRNYTLHPIPKEEQLQYATNFLNINHDTVIVPFSNNETAMQHFHDVDIKVVPIEIYELSGGYGAIHCMTSSLKRSK